MEQVRDKKILCVATPLYPPQIGGPATHVVFLEQNLSSDFDLRLVKFSDVANYPKGIKHIVYFFKILTNAFGSRMIYALDPVSVGFPALLASKVLGKKFVLRVGGDYAWEQGVQRFGVTATLDEFLKTTQSNRLVRTLQGIQSYVAKQADVVIAPSGYLAGVVKSWGVPIERVQVIYSQPEILESKQSRESAREALGIHENERIILSAGRLVPWKGFEALMEVVSTLPNGYTLAIAGAGPDEEKLQKKALDLSVSNRVRFLGQIPKEQMSLWLSASDVFVLNTKYEGLSHMILEAFSADIPVVTTPVGGNTELVVNEITGLLVAPDAVPQFSSAITKIVTDRVFANTLAQSARASLVRFNPEIAVSALVALFKSP